MLEESIEKCLYNLGLDKSFLDETEKVLTLKENILKLDFLKVIEKMPLRKWKWKT